MADYTHWHVGMKVVCVDDVWRYIDPARPDPDDFIERPVAGHVYTIREVVGGEEPAVLLQEIRNQPLHYVNGIAEASFFCRRFRPVQTRKTDISIFTAMLSPQKVEA